MKLIERTVSSTTCWEISAISSETHSLRSGTLHIAPPSDISKQCLLAIPEKWKIFSFRNFVVTGALCFSYQVINRAMQSSHCNVFYWFFSSHIISILSKLTKRWKGKQIDLIFAFAKFCLRLLFRLPMLKKVWTIFNDFENRNWCRAHERRINKNVHTFY